MAPTAAQGQGKHEALRGVKEWVIRHPLVGASKEQSQAVRHVLASEDFVISFKGPAGAGKTELMSEAVTAIESFSRISGANGKHNAICILRSNRSSCETVQNFQKAELTEHPPEAIAFL
jgi:AAA domain